MSDQRTEKPTQQRLRKAREKGQFPAAKEFVGAMQFFVLVLIASRCAEGWFSSAQQGLRAALEMVFQRRVWGPAEIVAFARSLVIGAFVPVAVSAGIIVGLTLAF